MARANSTIVENFSHIIDATTCSYYRFKAKFLKALTIGEVSRRSGVKVETIRYYERIHLLPPPPRTEGGHRLYPDGHLRRLNFIRRARELGFNLDEIRNLLNLVDDGYSCDIIKDAALKHLEDIRRKITDLRKMERILAETVHNCSGGRKPDCPIVDLLFNVSPGGDE